MDYQTYQRWNTYKRQYARTSKRRKSKKPTGNAGIATMTETRILQNLKAFTSQTRNETLMGVNYLVVPMTMAVSKVLNGSNGPLFYPADELSKIPSGWNMKPVCVHHPAGGTATTYAELEGRMVGHIMNCEWDHSAKKLRAEAWLLPARLEAIAPEILSKLQKNQTLEVSTGLHCDLYREPGTWNGEDYDFVARNLLPDHLAILPDSVGACSVADGCGLLTANKIPMFFDETPGNVFAEPVTNKKRNIPMFYTDKQTPCAEGLPLPTMNFESAGNAPKCPCTATNNAEGLPLPVMNFDGAQGNHAAPIVHNDADTLPLPSTF